MPVAPHTSHTPHAPLTPRAPHIPRALVGPHAFIARGYCPACRHELTGVPFALLVRCPECGAATKAGELALAPPPGALARFMSIPQGRHRKITWIVALGFAVLVIVGLLLPSLPPVSCRYCWSGRAAAQLRGIHVALQACALGDSAQYLPHAAMLVPLNYYPPDDFVDFRSATVENQFFGDVSLLAYDWSPEAATDLNAAIASCDVSAPYYRIGDFWLVRLPKPTHSALLVAGWCDVVADGERWVVFDDNQVRAVGRREWSRIWATDAGERARRGLLPVVPPPPWDSGSGEGGGD